MHARSKPNYVQILLSPRDGPPNGFCVREEWSYLVYDFFRRPLSSFPFPFFPVHVPCS
jgi:hypothetical protein